LFVAVTAQERYLPEFCSRNVLLKVNEVPVPTLVAFVRLLLVEFTYHSTTSEVTAFDQDQPEQVATVPMGIEMLEEIPFTVGYFATAGLAKDGIKFARLFEVAEPPSPEAKLMQ
jgi:hypothetical protein